jgi:nucleoside-diphosphate-sugar epimerase
MKRKNNILVTGGTGLVGRELIRLLIDKLPDSNITATYHSREPVVYARGLVWVRCDLANFQKRIFDNFIFDQVIHAAAFIQPGGTNSDDFSKEIFHTNILGTINLLDAIKLKKNAHIIYVSSAAVYKRGLESKFKETGDICPPHIKGAYAHSKVYTEWYLSKYFKRLAIVRPSYIYGRGMDKTKLLPRLLIQAMKGEILSLKPPFDVLCDYVHSADVSAGIYEALKKNAVGIYNLGFGQGTSIEELAKSCIKAADRGKLLLIRKNKLLTKTEQLFVSRQLVDITKARIELGWVPNIKLNEGLKDLMVWLKGE